MASSGIGPGLDSSGGYGADMRVRVRRASQARLATAEACAEAELERKAADGAAADGAAAEERSLLAREEARQRAHMDTFGGLDKAHAVDEANRAGMVLEDEVSAYADRNWSRLQVPAYVDMHLRMRAY